MVTAVLPAAAVLSELSESSPQAPTASPTIATVAATRIRTARPCAQPFSMKSCQQIVPCHHATAHATPPIARKSTETDIPTGSVRPDSRPSPGRDRVDEHRPRYRPRSGDIAATTGRPEILAQRVGVGIPEMPMVSTRTGRAGSASCLEGGEQIRRARYCSRPRCDRRSSR